MHYPSLVTDNSQVNRAYRIALGDLLGNIQPFQDGLLEKPEPVLLAGLDYDTPWTRDAAINVWNAAGLLWPQVARSTLLSVLERHNGVTRIGGQYWDAIIWALGAWAYCLQNDDQPFLALAHQALCASLARFEQEELDPASGLFRGPAVYGDGVAAYPDRYSTGKSSSILAWARANPPGKAPRGFGLPMFSLSTNCVYYQAYRIADWTAAALSPDARPVYAERAASLREQIRAAFWEPQLGTFRYLVDAEGGCLRQEGLGHSFALLFGIADEQQAASVLSKQVITAAGIPCVWPAYERYSKRGGFGRHSGAVWPFISGFWGEAALQHRRPDLFDREFQVFSVLINQHGQCAEIYHPQTGEVYGGLQECGKGKDGWDWEACTRQTWTASAYLRLPLGGICGLRFEPGGLRFEPYLPRGFGRIRLDGLPYRGATLDLRLQGRSGSLRRLAVDDQRVDPRQPLLLTGHHVVEMVVG